MFEFVTQPKLENFVEPTVKGVSHAKDPVGTYRTVKATSGKGFFVVFTPATK
jgi:hypothetical protein